VLKLLDKETLSKADLTEIFASVAKRPSRGFASSRKPPAGKPPVLTPGEIAKLDPKDVAALGNGNGSKPRANGSRTNGSRSSASTRSRANQTAKSTTSGRSTSGRTSSGRAASGRTTRKRNDGQGRQAPGTPA
jgi:cell division protease FtsH